MVLSSEGETSRGCPHSTEDATVVCGCLLFSALFCACKPSAGVENTPEHHTPPACALMGTEPPHPCSTATSQHSFRRSHPLHQPWEMRDARPLLHPSIPCSLGAWVSQNPHPAKPMRCHVPSTCGTPNVVVAVQAASSQPCPFPCARGRLSAGTASGSWCSSRGERQVAGKHPS